MLLSILSLSFMTSRTRLPHLDPGTFHLLILQVVEAGEVEAEAVDVQVVAAVEEAEVVDAVEEEAEAVEVVLFSIPMTQDAIIPHLNGGN